MNSRKAFNYFESHFELNKSTRGWYRFDFPLDNSHNDISGAVNFTIGVVKDHRSGYSKSIISFIMDYESLEYREAKELLESYHEADIKLYRRKAVEVSKVELPEGFNSLIDGEGRVGERARKYLESRGFDINVLDSKGFGYVSGPSYDFHGYIIIPFKSNGKLVYYIGRDFIGNPIKYRNPKTEDFGIGKSELLYNEDALNLYEEVFMTEGWSCSETIGDNSCATLGWNISRTQKSKIVKSSCKSIVIVPDKGVLENSPLTFYQKALQTGLQFVDYKDVYVIDIEKHLGPGKDVNEIGKEVIMQLREETQKLSYSLAIKYL